MNTDLSELVSKELLYSVYFQKEDETVVISENALWNVIYMKNLFDEFNYYYNEDTKMVSIYHDSSPLSKVNELPVFEFFELVLEENGDKINLINNIKI